MDNSVNELRARVNTMLGALDTTKVLVPELDKLFDNYIELKGSDHAKAEKENAMNSEIKSALLRQAEMNKVAAQNGRRIHPDGVKRSLEEQIKSIKAKYK